MDVSGGIPNSYGISANLNYRHKNLNWFVNYGINHRESPGAGLTLQERTNSEGFFISEQDIDRNRTRMNSSEQL